MSNTNTCYPNVSNLLIQQIKLNCPIFATNVGFASSAAVIQQAMARNLPTPACYVMPLAGGAEPNQYLNDYFQKASDDYGVIVVLDNSADVSGQNALANIDTVKWQLRAAVCNYNPDPVRSTRGMQYNSDQVVGFNEKYTWYQLDFSWEYQITPDDVWHVFGDPITDINITTAYNNISVIEDVQFSVIQVFGAEVGNMTDTAGVTVN